MNTLLQPGHHPDADQLSAFAEHALPAHEQQQTLAHLATCPDCRAVVFLAQQANFAEQAAPAETLQPHAIALKTQWLSRWFSGWNLAIPAAAALACLILVTIHLRNTSTPTNHIVPTATASLKPTQPPPPAAKTAPAHPALSAKPPRSSSGSISPSTAAPTKPRATAPTQPLETASNDAIALAPTPSAAPPPPAQATEPRAFAPRSAIAANGTINGTVTDQSGAAIPRATITATNTQTGVQLTRESAANGSFSLSPLQPGTYNIETAAPGFQRVLQQNVAVAPLQVAALDLKLPIGAVTQTVEVTNDAAALDTANASVAGTIQNELYTNLPLAAAGGAAPAASAQQYHGRVQAPQQQASAATSAQQGVYGGTGQSNLNQNYIAGVPAQTAPQTATPSAAPTVITGAAMDALSDDAASVDTLAAATAQLSVQPPLTILPSKLPARSVVANARQTLALDTAGSLFRSTDAGLTWHPIPAQWKGRALTLRLTASPAPATDQAAAQNAARISEAKARTQTPAAQTQSQPQSQTQAPTQAQIQTPAPPTLFELTTDNGAIWTSRDGLTWRLK